MTLTKKRRGNQDYIYDYQKDGGKIKSTYLGKVGAPETAAKVKAFGEEAAKKKEAKKKAKKKTTMDKVDETLTPILGKPADFNKDFGKIPKPAHWGERETKVNLPKDTTTKTPGEYRSPDERRKERDKSRDGWFI